MKIYSLFFALTNIVIFGVALPYVMIFINQYFRLSVYQNIYMKLIGTLFILLGVSVFFYCAKLFKSIGKGTPVPIEPPKKIVIEGIYKYTRNPIYIGYILVSFGYFFLFGHILLFVYSFVAIIGLHLYVLLIEELELKKRFGKTYLNYMKQVPRWACIASK